MKQNRALTKHIVEIPESASATTRDRRRDPHATQKIPIEELDEILRHTKSGTRRAVRTGAVRANVEVTLPGDRESYPEPRDDSPSMAIDHLESFGHIEVTRVFAPLSSQESDIDSVDPQSGVQTRDDSLASTKPVAFEAPIAESGPHAIAGAAPAPVSMTPRMAFFAGALVMCLVAASALVAFFVCRRFPFLK